MPEIIVIPPTKASHDTARKVRMAAYTRVSSNSEDQKKSFLTQMDYYTHYIKSNPDMEFVDLYADEGVTGTKTDKRDEFNRMLEDCRQGKIDCIITKSVSRFARNTVDCINIVRELKSIGVNVIFEENGIDTRTLTGESELITLCSIAQEESMSISKNVRMGNRYKMAKGTYKQGHAPYGYKIVDGKFVINEEQAEIVRLIFMAYKEGKSLAKIASELTKMGIAKSSGNTLWRPNQIKNILANVRYKGDALFQKTFMTGFPYKKVKNRGELDMYYQKNVNPSIVTAELFDICNARLTMQARHFNSGTYQESPLNQRIYCAACGCAYRKKQINLKTYWVCSEHSNGSQRCTNPPIGEEMVYGAFVQLANRLVKNREFILDHMLENLQMIKESRLEKNKVYQLTEEIAKLTEQILVINRLRSRGYMESASYIEKVNEINSQIVQLRKEKKRLMGNSECDRAIKDTQTVIKAIEQRGSIHSFDKELFEAIVNRMIANRHHLTFQLINGLHLTIDVEEL